MLVNRIGLPRTRKGSYNAPVLARQARPLNQMPPGEYLREVRLRLGLGMRDVQQLSSKIALAEQNKRFYISAARLTQIESGDAVPSQFKAFTLAAIYGIAFHHILARFGVDPDRTHVHRARIKLAATRPVSAELSNLEATVTIPARLDPSFKWDRTQLINRAVALWGEIPAALLLECSLKRHMFVYIGTEDNTMEPLLKPGSLLMIDDERREVTSGGWRNEFERPIYLIEFREGYLCSWCQVSGSTLTIVPHPLSGAHVRTFNSTSEAEVIGQVVGVAMRLVPPAPAIPAHSTGQPAPS